MKITVTISLLVALSHAADTKSKEKNAPCKTDERDLPEGNYGDRIYLKNVLRSAQGIDFSHHEDSLADRPSHVFSSAPRIAKISDVLSSEGPHYSGISDHLFSPVSAYHSRLSSPSFDQNSELGLSGPEPKHKSSKKHKKPKSSPKRTYPPYEPRPLQFDTLSSFASYRPELSQFRNLYQEPTFSRGLFSPKLFAEPSIFRPIRPVAPQYYPQIYQQPSVFPHQGIPPQRFHTDSVGIHQPVQYIQQAVEQVVPSVPYTQRAQQVIPGLQYSQGAPTALSGFAYPQVQQAVSSPAFAQLTHQAAPGVLYAQQSQQIIPAYNPNVPQVAPGGPYAQGARQVIPGLAYPQGVQQLVPNVAYVQGPQQLGVIYAQQTEASTSQKQSINVAQQQSAPQQYIQPQQVQGAVSYASFSQSLPQYSQAQPQAQQEQAPQPQYTQSQNVLLPARPGLQQTGQPQHQVPDSQPQQQQISESHPTSQPEEEQVVTILPGKNNANDQNNQKESLNTDFSSVEPTTQPAPGEITHQQPTQAPIVVSTLSNFVPSNYQQTLQEVRPQQAENVVTYPQQGPEAYPQGVVYQQPELVNGAVAPTLPSVQYFGNFAESLFGNYQ